MGALITRLFHIVTSMSVLGVLVAGCSHVLCTLGAAECSWCLPGMARSGRRVCTAAFIGVRAICPASKTASKQPNWYGRKAAVPPTSACCHQADTMKSILLLIARNTESPSMSWNKQPTVLMTRESDTRMIGFHISHGMRLWCQAQQPMRDWAERE